MFSFSFGGGGASSSTSAPGLASASSLGPHPMRPARKLTKHSADDGGKRFEEYSTYDDDTYDYSDDGYGKSRKDPDSFKQFTPTPSFSHSPHHQQEGAPPGLDVSDMGHQSAEDITRIMQRMKHENRKNRYVQNCLVYGVFLALLLISQFLNWNVQSSYYFTEVSREYLLNEEFLQSQTHILKTHADIGQSAEFFSWLEGPLAGGLFSASNYAATVPSAQWGAGEVAMQNRLFGRIRFRQKRVAGQQCVWNYASTMPALFQTQCYPEWSNSKEDTAPFGGSTGTMWTHSSKSQTGTHSWQSTTTYFKYNAAGYVIDVPANPTAWQAAIDNMRDNGWIDRQTRGIFLNINLYNQNLDLYQSIQVLTEFTAAGMLLSRDARIMTYRIDPWETGADKFRLACSILAMIFVIVYLFIWFRDFYITAQLDGFFAYFADFWVWLDFINLVCYIVAFGLRLGFITHPLRQSLLTIGDQQHAKDEYHNVEVLMGRVATINGFMALNIFISFCKSFKYLQVNPRLGFLWRVLQKAYPDLISFLLLFFIVFFGFACMGHILYGPYMFEWRTFWTSSFALARMIFGDFNYLEMEIHHPTWTPIFFNLYMILVYFIMINMFLAIMNDAFAIVNTSPAPPETAAIAESWKNFKNRIKKFFGQDAAAEAVTRKLAERDIITRLAESGVLAMETVTIHDLREALGPDAPPNLADTIMSNYDKDGSGVLERGELQNLAPLAERYNVRVQKKDHDDGVLNDRVRDTFQRRIVELQRNLDDVLRELDQGNIKFAPGHQDSPRAEYMSSPRRDIEHGGEMYHRRPTGHNDD